MLGAAWGLTDGAPGLLILFALSQALGVRAQTGFSRQPLRAHEAVSVTEQRAGVWAGAYRPPGPSPLGGPSTQAQAAPSCAYLRYSVGLLTPSAPLSVPSDGHWLTRGVVSSLEPWARGAWSPGIRPVLGWGGGGQAGWEREQKQGRESQQGEGLGLKPG